MVAMSLPLHGRTLEFQELGRLSAYNYQCFTTWLGKKWHTEWKLCTWSADPGLECRF